MILHLWLSAVTQVHLLKLKLMQQVAILGFRANVENKILGFLNTQVLLHFFIKRYYEHNTTFVYILSYILHTNDPKLTVIMRYI